MVARFEELAWGSTPIGEISLRRRREPTLGVDVYEVKLGDDYLMSSLFTQAEVELARLGLAAHPGSALDVLVGGLGLGYTAQAALEDPRVTSLTVVDAVGEVIDWHRRQLLPDTTELSTDDRCRLVQADFFATIAAGPGSGSEMTGQRYHAVLVDIDHTPSHVLYPTHAAFYTPDGLQRLTKFLHPGGVFALWSDDPPDPDFETSLGAVFTSAQAHVVAFPNPLTGGESSNTVYVATLA